MSPTDGETMIGPRREELKKILYSHGINNYDIPGGEPAAISSGHWCFRILTDVMNWADRWTAAYQVPAPEQQKKVSRESLQLFLSCKADHAGFAHMLFKSDCNQCQEVLDSILALLNGEEEPSWCGCWKRCGKAWKRVGGNEALLSDWALNDWKLCPICGKERPKGDSR